MEAPYLSDTVIYSALKMSYVTMNFEKSVPQRNSQFMDILRLQMTRFLLNVLTL